MCHHKTLQETSYLYRLLIAHMYNWGIHKYMYIDDDRCAITQIGGGQFLWGM